MTSERIFNTVAAYLRSKVEAAQGVFDASDSLANTLGLLKAAPQRWRVILQWQREDPTGNRGEMRLKLLLIVQQAQGLQAQPGQMVTLGDQALLKRFNLAASWMRSLLFHNADVAQRPWTQGSSYWLTDPAFPTRQIAGEFSIEYGMSPVDVQRVTIPT